MSDGFLGRWSRRKLDTAQGKTVEAEATPVPATLQPPPAAPLALAESAIGEKVDGESQTESAPAIAASVQQDIEAGSPAPLTLEDVKALTAESDFTRFAASDVAPDVKNAAMKKLFSDPRYNVMDGMDVYTGDYSKPDPIPQAMLRQLASAKFLGLFDQEEKEEEAARQASNGASDPGDVAAHPLDVAVQPGDPAQPRDVAAQPRDVADNPTAETVAQSDITLQEVPEACDHADPDLRLQQDHAAPGKDPGRGIE